MKSNLVASLMMICLVFPASAQDTAQASSAAATDKPHPFLPERKVKVFCLAADTGIPSMWVRTLSAKEGGGSAAITAQSVSIPFSKRSEPIAYQGPAGIEFFDKEPPPGPPFNDKGERQGPSPVAIAKLPADQQEILLLFIPLAKENWKGNLQFRVIPFDDSKDKLPWGSYRLVNFTNHSLTGFAGGRDVRFDLQPNSASGTIAPGGDKRNLLWLIYDTAKGVEKPVFSAQWLHRPDYRSLVFITDSQSQRGAISVKSIDEWRQ